MKKGSHGIDGKLGGRFEFQMPVKMEKQIQALAEEEGVSIARILRDLIKVALTPTLRKYARQEKRTTAGTLAFLVNSSLKEN